MAPFSVPRDRAAILRDLAVRARRLATDLPEGRDRVRLFRHADELDQEAACMAEAGPGPIGSASVTSAA